jgi:hypothetical protein
MATAAINYVEVENTAMTGSEVTYTFDVNATSTLFRARGGDIEMRSITTGDYYTIKADATYELTEKNMRSRVLFFTGASGVVLEAVINKEYQNKK